MNPQALQVLQSFDPHQFVIVGSSVMQQYRLRLADDVDIVVSHGLWKKLEDWQPQGHMRVKEGIEAAPNWAIGDYELTFEELCDRGFWANGFQYASLQDVLEWKKRRALPKDKLDCQAIEQYLQHVADKE